MNETNSQKDITYEELLSEHETRNKQIEFADFRIDTLQQIIPQKIKEREKKAGQRIFIAWGCISIFFFFILLDMATPLQAFDGLLSFLSLLLIAPIIAAVALFVVYGIASFTFCKNMQEAMDIELLKLELDLLKKQTKS